MHEDRGEEWGLGVEHSFAEDSVCWPDSVGLHSRPTTDCVSLGKLLHPSELLLFHLKNGAKLQRV